MTRARYRVITAEVAEQHEGETVWRVRVRSPERMTDPALVLYVSQPAGRPVPYDAGTLVDLDERLLEREA